MIHWAKTVGTIGIWAGFAAATCFIANSTVLELNTIAICASAIAATFGTACIWLK